MNRRRLIRTIALLTLLVAGGPVAVTHNFLRIQPQDHSEGTKFTGLYRNEAWGYEVVIPKNVAGYNDSAGPQHGFGITLGQAPESSVLVQGEANSLEYKAPVDAALRHLSFLRDDEKEIESVSIKPARLGTLQASEMVVTYIFSGSREQYTMAAVFALGPKKSPVYEIILDSPTSRYLHDRAVLDQLVKSWKYTGY